MRPPRKMPPPKSHGNDISHRRHPRKVSPANGSDFRLEEMQRMVGGIIEIVYFEDNTVMVINEEGKLLGLPLNMDATVIFRAHYPDSNDYIVGDALVCSEKQIL